VLAFLHTEIGEEVMHMIGNRNKKVMLKRFYICGR